MIYCNLRGGLGNILFQIAATISFSSIKKVKYSFPNFEQHLQSLDRDTTHNPSLKHAEEYKKFLNIHSEYPTEPLKTYYYPFEYTDFIPPESKYIIDGFFQSEKYFCNSRSKILDLFKPSKEIQDTINSKYSFFLEEETVSIHLRRGDFLNLPDHHPVQSVEYYESALSTIEQAKKIENVIIFSDNIEWCKNNLKFKNSIFIENEKDYIELFLMSKCSNNIISNSSFSWWGAWLNNSAKKIVVAPKKWFGEKIRQETKDIIPESWIIL